VTEAEPRIQITHPYAQAARGYRAAGWQGALPIIGKQDGLPTGYTGRQGAWPDDHQVEQWITARGADNICLRLPADVIGIDVDAYDGRRGLQTIDWLTEQTGVELPGTWTSSSRSDGSGIRFFRVPEVVNWVSDLGHDSGVEIVRYAHRYAVIWPSVHPQTGGRYTWRTPEGRVVDRIPHVEELEALPVEWITALTRGHRPPRPPGPDGTGGDLGGSGPGGDGGVRHGTEDVPTVDGDGQAVDVDRILLHGIPIGEQQNELYRYVCSMRGRGLRRSEMIALGMVALQNLENAPGRDPWTQDDVVRLVDRVRDEFGPGNASLPGMSDATLAWARRVAEAASAGDGVGGVDVNESPPREPINTDMGNSLRVAAVLGDRLRYVADSQRWYVWDGRRWEPDTLNRALDLTKEVIDSIRFDALRAEGDDRTTWVNWARESESLGRRKAMLAGAEAEPALVTTTAHFDADPHLLVVRNGTLDLTTGQLRESRRDDHCSQLAEVDFDPDAPAERWLSHIKFLCDGDPVLAAYIQRAVGYTLTGDVGARSFFFLEGTGSNGKNAFIEPIIQMMGSYAKTASTALLTGGDEQHPTILADLLGARLVFVDETRQGKALNVERVKALTGSKRVKAHYMRKDFFEFDAQFKLWIAGNGQPTIKDPSDGIWNRMHRVICKGKVDESRKILGFGDLLYREEASGILNWALQGLLAWRQLGTLGVPESVKADVQAYRDDEDYIGQFMEDCIELTGNPDDVLDFKVTYDYYRTWAEEAGLRKVDVKPRNQFSQLVKAHGIETGKKSMGGTKPTVMFGVRPLGMLAFHVGFAR
jgi:P4 family phage/plasmid primase-like protien